MMRSLSSELAPLAQRLSGRPRVYADANVPAGVVGFMRTRLKWDVLSVVEDAEMRRLSDVEHFQTAQRLSRTLVTLDRDYLDDRRFPVERCCGVLVLSAADEAGLMRLLSRLDRRVFRPRSSHRQSTAASQDWPDLPLAGRKLYVHPGWTGTP